MPLSPSTSIRVFAVIWPIASFQAETKALILSIAPLVLGVTLAVTSLAVSPLSVTFRPGTAFETLLELE